MSSAIQPSTFLSRPLVLLVAGQAVAALMTLVYGKLTAVYIPPDEWGHYSLLVAAVALLHSFLITPTIQSFKAAITQFSHRQAIRFYRRILLLIYATVAPMAALVAGLYYQNTIFGLVWIAAVGQGIYQFGNDYLNASGQHQRYVMIQLGYAISSLLIFAIFSIGVGHRTSIALWQSISLLNSLFAVLACWQLYRATHASKSLPERTIGWIELWQPYKQYVAPLLRLAFWSWGINYADRYLIRLYMTDADVGQYTMGYSLGSKLLLVAAPLLAFLVPQVVQFRAAGQPAIQTNLLLLGYLARYLVVAGSGCFLFYLSREWAGELLLSDRYKPAFCIGPVVAIGYLFLTSIHLLEVKWYAFGQTRLVLWHNVAGAIMNLSLNVVLIPRFGIFGAALATLLGFMGQFLLAIWLFLSPKLNCP